MSAANGAANASARSAWAERERDSMDAAKPQSSVSFPESMAKSDPPRTDQEAGEEGRDSSMSESERVRAGRSPGIESMSEVSVVFKSERVASET